jgi:hypothetical protein
MAVHITTDAPNMKDTNEFASKPCSFLRSWSSKEECHMVFQDADAVPDM